MSALIALALGSTLLAVLAGYLLWVKVRQLRLQIELLEILCELERAARDANAVDDSEYKSTRGTIKSSIKYADALSLLAFIYFIVDRDREKEAELEATGPLAKPVNRAREKVGLAVVTHVLYETISGALVRFVAWILPSTTVKKRLRDGVTESVHAIDHMSHSAAGC
jgi:hypothetical protein